MDVIGNMREPVEILEEFTSFVPSSEWIVKESGLPWLELDIVAPKEQLFKEIDSLRNDLILNCSNVSKDSPAYEAREQYKSMHNTSVPDHNWKFITLYGVSNYVVEDAFNYKGLKNNVYSWTEAGDKCPAHKEFINKHFNLGDDFYIKYAVLEPGGYTLPHTDCGIYEINDPNYNPGSELYALTFMIKNAPGNIFNFHQFGHLPITEGRGFLLNVDYFHCTHNKSNENRYHLMIINTNRKNKSILDAFKDKTLLQKSWTNSFSNFKN